jgi:hypothetical protein
MVENYPESKYDHCCNLKVNQVKSKYNYLKACYRQIVEADKKTGNIKHPKKKVH